MTQPILAWTQKTAPQLLGLVRVYSRVGYRCAALELSGEVPDLRHGAVLVPGEKAAVQQCFLGQSVAEFRQTCNALAAQGWGPSVVAATGQAEAPLVSSVFEVTPASPFVRIGLSEPQFIAVDFQASSRSFTLHCADSYGPADDLRFIAVWRPT